MATLVAVASGCAGVFVVLRRASFAAHALPMAAFPGAAGAILLGVGQVYGLVVAGMVGVGLLLWLQRGQRRDAATALVLVALLALGALFLSLTGRYADSVYALLFGQVFAARPADVAPACLLALLVPAGLIISYRPLLLSAVSQDLASVRGVIGWQMELVFLALLALSAGMALPVTGALLVFSLMTGPAGAACAVARSPQGALCLSVLFALGLVWTALTLSILTNWPAGFFTGAGAAALYVAAQFSRRWASKRIFLRV